MTAATETALFEEGDVTVSPSEISFAGTAYDPRSISTVTTKDNTALTIAFCIAGLAVALYSIVYLWPQRWVTIMGLLVVMFAYYGRGYTIYFKTTDGREVRAYKHPNKGYITRLVAAINEAIVDGRDVSNQR